MNQWTICGNVGRDPVKDYTQNGSARVRFSMALDNGRDRAPDWVDVTVFNERLQNVVMAWVKKGSSLIVVGRAGERHWQSQTDGAIKGGLTILADRIELVGRRADGAEGQEAAAAPEAPAVQAPQAVDVPDDELPF